jgi:murein DD-endopeptidase MepM/ murein hydrolase activator NlpD
VQRVRFDFTNSQGVLFAGQYSDGALMKLFDSAIDRKRIEPTAKQTLTLGAGERKAISDIFMDFPKEFVGDNLAVQVDYRSDKKDDSKKVSIPLNRTAAFSGRLPFDGTWYVMAEHGFFDPHKRFLAEAFAYDFNQIGANGKSYQRDGRNNADYYAYGKKVLSVKDGTVVAIRNDVAENVPGEHSNINTPGGNIVVLDHGNNQFSYYGHLRPFTIKVKRGAQVRAGDVLGEVGNSGDSLEPQLHFHVMNGPDPTQADGIPAVFENWNGQSYGRFPQPRQQGVIPRGEFVSSP